MQYGQITGIQQPIAKLVMGTMVCTTDDMDSTCELLDAYVKAGGNCLDTAYIYGGGKSERAIGEWMRMRNNRERMLLIDKGAHPRPDGLPRVNPHAIEEDLAESLERLGTDYIDLYLLHRDDPDYPVGPIVECLHAQQESGRIRAFGASNWTHRRIREANDYAAVHGLNGFVASSPYFGLAVQNEPPWTGCVALDKEGWEWHRERQFPLLPWSSQARGFFTGRYTPDIHTDPLVERVFYCEQNWERLRRARELGKAKDATANQIALAFVLHQPFPVFPLIGPRNPQELHDSLGAFHISLTPEEIRWLNLEI
jgi:aryl-alcohol dehydrogenase-like predicted oxidoreductase